MVLANTSLEKQVKSDALTIVSNLRVLQWSNLQVHLTKLHEANGLIHSPFLLIVSEKIGKIAQVATFEDISAISRWLSLSAMNTLLFN